VLKIALNEGSTIAAGNPGSGACGDSHVSCSPTILAPRADAHVRMSHSLYAGEIADATRIERTFRVVTVHTRAP